MKNKIYTNFLQRINNKNLIFAITFMLLSSLSLNAQNLLQNGYFYDGLDHWFTNNEANMCGQGWVCINDNDDDVNDNFGWTDGLLAQDFQFKSGVEYTFKADIKRGFNLLDDEENSTLYFYAFNPSPLAIQLIASYDMEDYSQNNFTVVNSSFTANTTFEKFIVLVDGFDYQDNTSPNDDGFILHQQSSIVDNIVIESIHAPNFEIQNQNGNNTSFFCSDNNVILNAEETLPVERYKMNFRRRALVDGDDAAYQWLGTTPWINESNVGSHNLSEVIETFGHTLYYGYEYKVTLVIDNAFSGWWGREAEFTLQNNQILEFEITDANGLIEDIFCTDDEIFFDGSSSQYEEEYLLFVSQLSSSNQTNWQVSSGWINELVGEFSLTEFVQNLGHEFSPGFQYKVKLHLKNRCYNPISEEQSFFVENCCAPPQELSCYNKFGQVYLDWEDNTYGSNYFVEISYNNPICCDGGGQQSNVIHYLKKGDTSFPVPNSLNNCFAWRIIMSCDKNSIVSDWACFDSSVGCLDIEFNSDELYKRSKKLAQVKVFPNPASDMIYIDDNIERDNYKLSLINMNGQLINEYFDTKRIDISNVNNGVYILVIQSNDEIIYRESIVITH